MDATVQVNVRMGRSLKKSGDEALALIGYSPSQAVRALWEKASMRGRDLEEVADLLAPAPRDNSVIAEGENPIVAGWAMMDEALRSLGIDPGEAGTPFDSAGASDNEMLAEALFERMEERGSI